MTTGEKIETVTIEKGFQTVCPAGTDERPELQEIAYIGRSEYKLGVLDATTKQRKWGGSFLDYSSHAALDAEDYNLNHLTASSSGLMATLDEVTGELLWEKDFGSPVAGLLLWDISGLQRVPFSTFVSDALKMLLNPTDPSVAFLKQLPFKQRTMVLKPAIE